MDDDDNDCGCGSCDISCHNGCGSATCLVVVALTIVGVAVVLANGLIPGSGGGGDENSDLVVSISFAPTLAPTSFCGISHTNNDAVVAACCDVHFSVDPFAVDQVICSDSIVQHYWYNCGAELPVSVTVIPPESRNSTNCAGAFLNRTVPSKPITLSPTGTAAPTATFSPTRSPSTPSPTTLPTISPTAPTLSPTVAPTSSPATRAPTTSSPTVSPTVTPSFSPTVTPSLSPTQPTAAPLSSAPTGAPTGLGDLDRDATSDSQSEDDDNLVLLSVTIPIIIVLIVIMIVVVILWKGCCCACCACVSTQKRQRENSDKAENGAFNGDGELNSSENEVVLGLTSVTRRVTHDDAQRIASGQVLPDASGGRSASIIPPSMDLNRVTPPQPVGTLQFVQGHAAPVAAGAVQLPSRVAQQYIGDGPPPPQETLPAPFYPQHPPTQQPRNGSVPPRIPIGDNVPAMVVVFPFEFDLTNLTDSVVNEVKTRGKDIVMSRASENSSEWLKVTDVQVWTALFEGVQVAKVAFTFEFDKLKEDSDTDRMATLVDSINHNPLRIPLSVGQFLGYMLMSTSACCAIATVANENSVQETFQLLHAIEERTGMRTHRLQDKDRKGYVEVDLGVYADPVIVPVARAPEYRFVANGAADSSRITVSRNLGAPATLNQDIPVAKSETLPSQHSGLGQDDMSVYRASQMEAVDQTPSTHAQTEIKWSTLPTGIGSNVQQRVSEVLASEVLEKNQHRAAPGTTSLSSMVSVDKHAIYGADTGTSASGRLDRHQPNENPPPRPPKSLSMDHDRSTNTHDLKTVSQSSTSTDPQMHLAMDFGEVRPNAYNDSFELPQPYLTGEAVRESFKQQQNLLYGQPESGADEIGYRYLTGHAARESIRSMGGAELYAPPSASGNEIPLPTLIGAPQPEKWNLTDLNNEYDEPEGRDYHRYVNHYVTIMKPGTERDLSDSSLAILTEEEQREVEMDQAYQTLDKKTQQMQEKLLALAESDYDIDIDL